MILPSRPERTSRRRWAALLAASAVVAVAAGGYVWWSRATPPSRTSAVEAPDADPRPPALPDLRRLDAAVQQQVRDQHAALTRILGNPASSRSEKSEAFGALGTLLLATEYAADAEAAFLGARALAPSDMRWPYYLGHVYRTRQEPARAIPMFERVLALAPDDVPSLVWLGELHLATGNAGAAEPYLTRALEAQPASAAAVFGLGRVALARKDYARAIERFERTLQLQPGASGVHYQLGMAFRGAGRISQADAHLRQADESAGVAPADPLMDAVAALLTGASAFEARGMQALEARDWKGAVEHLRQAVALAPGNAPARLNLGTALSLLGDAKAARHELQEAVRLAPTLAKAHFGLGVLDQDEGRWDAAIRSLSAAVTHDPGFVDAHFTLAEALRRTGRLEESLSHYRHVLQLNAAASQARFGHAMALVRLRRYAEARAWLSEAVRLHPDQPGFPHALARILAAAPDPQARDGRQALALMQPLVPSQPGAAVSETMAMAYAELGRFEEAVAWQERAMAEARKSGPAGLAARMQDNLAQYRARQPCRTPWRDDDPVIAVVSP